MESFPLKSRALRALAACRMHAAASHKNLARFTGSKALIPSVYKRQYACQRLKSALAASSSSVGASPPSSSSLPAPVLSCRQVRRSFSGADLVAGKADEAGGLSPGNEDNAASCPRCPEKPCCLLYTEGAVCCANRFAVSVRPLPHSAGERTVFIPFARKQALLPRVFPAARCCARGTLRWTPWRAAPPRRACR